MDSPVKQASCFSFLPKVTRKRTSFRSRRKRGSAARASWPTFPSSEAPTDTEEPRKKNDTGVEIVTFSKEGNVKTNAVYTCNYKAQSRANIRSAGTSQAASTGKQMYISERLIVSPFFGPFAGRDVIFDLRALPDPLPSIKVKLRVVTEEEDSLSHITTLYHGSAGLASGDSVLDRCIKFVHENKHSFDHRQNQQPNCLQFLCKKEILLNFQELDVCKLPKKLTADIELKPSYLQEVVIKVWWPSHIKPPTVLKMTLLKGLLVSELKWMLCHRLSLPMEPKYVQLYKNDDIETMSSETVTSLHCNLNCIISPLPDCISTVITVSIIGQGIRGIVIDKSMTLFDFQEAVRSTFSIKRSSFIYFPSIYRLKHIIIAESGLRMTATVDDSTLSLISSMRRNFPIVDGVPSLLLDHSKIPLYKLNINELEMSSPLVGFEVTGPTIPLQITTTQGFDVSKDFVIMSKRIHAVSVNPKWTVQTLLKYMECVSRFPCHTLRIGEITLSESAVVGQHLTNRCWLMQNKYGLTLAPDIPIIQN